MVQFQFLVRYYYILRLRRLLLNTFILAPPAPPVSTVSGSFYLPSSSYRPPPSEAVFYHSTSLWHPIPTSSPGAGGALSTWTLPTPAACQPPLLASMPCAACLHLPPFPVSVRLPFASLGLHSGPCWTLGGSFVVKPSIYLVSPPLLPYVLRLFAASSCSWSLYRVSIFVRGQGARAPPLPGNHSPRPLPPPRVTW